MRALQYRNRAALVFRIAFGLLATLHAPTTAKSYGKDSSEVTHWQLALTATDVDISPDDRLLAITVESPVAPQKSGEKIVEFLEVWDYRQHIRISNTQLATYVNIKPTPNAVRFSADGLLLAASDPTTLHVIEAATLKSIRVIQPPLEDGFRIFGVETSPTGHLAIVTANRNTSGVLFAYDLDTGKLLFQWRSPHSLGPISWSQDGTLFAAADPLLCTRVRDTVQVFSTNPWKHLRTLSARNPVSLAFSKERLYFVESSFCKGSMFDRHLGLESFTIDGWKRNNTKYLPHEDIHTSVSFASGRLLADTGQVRTEHDWLDATVAGFNVNARFSVWMGDSSTVEVTSRPLAISDRRGFLKSGMRLSRTGKMVLLYPPPQVFRIP